ncbi:MAG: ATP-binding cassette domain-containing protein [Micromonosporaceae bacterium]|nr:ATP-binding cassette domain-containing protein [Micromonosporaceae bacterium]
MRETLRAYRTGLGFGFQAAPVHATFQLLLGVLMALSIPVGAYGGKLLVDAAVAGELGQALIAAGLLAANAALLLVLVFYYVDCVFGVIERADVFANRRLMRLLGGTHGLAHFERPDYLDQVHRIREQRDQLAGMVNASTGVLRATVTLAATAVLLARVHPVLVLLPVFAVLSFWAGKRSKDLDIAAQEATSEPDRLRRHLFEVATAAPSGKELRVFGLAGGLLHRHHQVSETVLRARNRASWWAAVLQSLAGLVAGLAYAGAIAVVLVLAVDGRATPGDVILVVALAAQLNNAVLTGVIYTTAFLRVLAVARRFGWLADYADRARRTVADPAPVPTRLTGGITLREVSFGYPDQGGREAGPGRYDRGLRSATPAGGRPVLDRVSLHLPAGAVVALVGENGAGKTTLVKLLCDFYQPDGGQILVDGVDLARFPPEAWRERLSAAYQDFAQFELLARETIGVADLPRLDDQPAATAALAAAGGTDLLAVLPAGLETQLGTRWEGGVDLSGGQWQKLALARGLRREDPLLVVFDEPTAALDPQTEHALFERFAAAARAGTAHGTVTLLVSHRFSTVRMADLIVVLDGGRVRETGSHAELVAAGGLYAELYQLQSRAYQ